MYFLKLNLDKMNSGENFGGNLEIMGGCPLLANAGTSRTFPSKYIGINFNYSKYEENATPKKS